MKLFALTVLLLVGVGCASSGYHGRGHHGQCTVDAADAQRIESQIAQMIHDSAKAWSANDLDGFMASFHNSPDLLFATPGGITTGWADLKVRYAKSIAKSDLRFSDVKVDVLSPTAALVFIRFHNDMNDGGYGTGLSTLLVREIDGRWVIVHDHSSGLPVEAGQ